MSTTRQEHSAIDDVVAERRRQDDKWGIQDRPDGTGPTAYEGGSGLAEWHQHQCTLAALCGRLTYRHILLEEVYEALAEDDKAKLRVELIQVAAVAVAWVEKLDREAAASGLGDHA